MKENFIKILTTVAAFSFLSFFNLASPKYSIAVGGSCACIVGATRTCGITSNNCDIGYSPTCTSTIASCNGTATSCTCVAVNPTTMPNCGGPSQPCCPGGVCNDPANYSCATTAAGDFCVSVAQGCCLPGGPPPGVDCTNVICEHFVDPAKVPKIFCVGNDPDNRTSKPADPKNAKIATAIGCIPIANEQEIAKFFLTWGIGIAGGIALILVAVSGYMVSTSSGDPRRLQAGKELLTAAISGLVLLVFAAYILRIVGLDILQIPGF